MRQSHNKLYILLTYVVLAFATFIAYEQVRHNEFVDYDDYTYVVDNSYVNRGITRESVVWAFTTPLLCNWHPLTQLSHTLDCELFGLNPLWHHLTSLLFHIAATLLLFWVLKRMTGKIWCSAFVAAAFALHPLHVESVAWVAERKDVLSGFFWMLTIAAYIRYAKRAGIGSYLLVLLSFSMGLMAKPMVVTLPFVLLLLDYWPLGRFEWRPQSRLETLSRSKSVGSNRHGRSVLRLIGEKIPLFALAAVSSVIAYIVQQKGGAMAEIPLNFRIFNALNSCFNYIVKMAYPSGLAVLYPFQTKLRVDMALLVIVGISICAVLWRRQRPWLIVGWLWYLGTLVPVIGLVSVGDQAMADRYTYLPSIGIFIVVAWGAAELLGRWRYRKIGLAISAGIVLTALLVCTRMQVRHWRNDLTLFGHAIEVTKNNYRMHNRYGVALDKKGLLDKAITHYKKAIRIHPYFTPAYNNLGSTLARQGKLNEAVLYFTKALEIDFNFADAHNNLGYTLMSQGNLDRAVTHFIKALQLNPSFTAARYNLAQALAENNKIDEAIIHFREILRIDPDLVAPMNNLAWLLATHKESEFYNPQEAVRIAERACELTEYSRIDSLDTLAAAYASAGRFSEAVTIAEKALYLSQSSGHNRLTEQIQNRLSLYKTSRGYVETLPHLPSD